MNIARRKIHREGIFGRFLFVVARGEGGEEDKKRDITTDRKQNKKTTKDYMQKSERGGKKDAKNREKSSAEGWIERHVQRDKKKKKVGKGWVT